MTAPQTVTSTADLEPSGVGGYAKAIWAGAAAALTTLGTAATDGQITLAEWIGMVVAGIAAGVGTYWVANKVKPVTVVPVPEPILGVVMPPVDPEGNNPQNDIP